MDQITPEFKQQVVDYAKQNGREAASKHFGVYINNINYWMDENYKEREKLRNLQNYHAKMKNDPEFAEKRRQIQKERPIEQKKEYHKDYYLDHKESMINTAKTHRLANAEHYKELARQRYLKAKLKKKESTQ